MPSAQRNSLQKLCYVFAFFHDYMEFLLGITSQHLKLMHFYWFVLYGRFVFLLLLQDNA